MNCNYRILFVAILFIISCNNPNKPSNITNEIEGKYVFKYPSGQIEMLIINLDSTFNQNIYSTENDYLNKRKPLYENNGNWTISGKEIEFNHWLTYCYLRNPDSILVEPVFTTMLDVTWHAPIDEHESKIDIYSENGYVLKKEKK